MCVCVCVSECGVVCLLPRACWLVWLFVCVLFVYSCVCLVLCLFIVCSPVRVFVLSCNRLVVCFRVPVWLVVSWFVSVCLCVFVCACPFIYLFSCSRVRSSVSFA